MSRSRNQHHPASRSGKLPSPYLDKEGKIPRRRKRRPYGSLGWKGWGGETYFSKWGELMLDVINKRKARNDWKKELKFCEI